MENKYKMNIGIEVHVELSTQSKIFCPCSTAFGGQPNSQTCPICTGMPGTLPRLNKKVLDYGIKAGKALNCKITRQTSFDRKNYFYPDLPKAYQTSQLYFPLGRQGYLEIEDEGKKTIIGIHEIHMEEDAGKLIHDPQGAYTLVDYNRAGVPLLEIVSEPDMESSQEAIAYLETLRDLFVYLELSDCKMQEGSFRADINLSIRPKTSEKMGNRTEMKNLNSFRSVVAAIGAERDRQVKLLEKGELVVQETRGWDDKSQESFSMRLKEESGGYAYFTDPDIPVIRIDDKWIEEVSQENPELRPEKINRYQEEYGLPLYDAQVLTKDINIARLFEQALETCNKPKELSNWIMMDLMEFLRAEKIGPEDIVFTGQEFSQLINMVGDGLINRGIGKEILGKMLRKKIDVKSYIKEKGLGQVGDEKILEEIVEKVFKENPQALEDYRAGKKKALGYLMGQAMKALKGKGDPQKIRRIISKKTR